MLHKPKTKLLRLTTFLSPVKKCVNLKCVITLLVVFGIAHLLNAQDKVLLHDQEKLFTTVERKQIDSLLQYYYKAKGNYVSVVTTDTLDINPGDYSKRFAEHQNLSGLQNNYGLVLLMSRKQELIYLTGTGQLVHLKDLPQVQDALTGIISAGIPDLQEKRTAEGVMKICGKAMKFIDEVAKIMQEPAPKR
ncbi:MAG TPA: TPM domain-containing protein [Cyclobacteriaceae bacterium]|jgi:uncharacterized membrane protein YgcG|nr:TPM domain-containing protein [Cytophagales bacterium]HRE67853.1 TPM domain-containing protein [Cyclobacteriaceae bacterium]HRF33865.1 TPM domain-containing protein [Cyclobacteriaceae bacterium]